MNKQSGFTLIEIVMVLVLLGILSAVAVPKYFDLQKQAELKAAQAIAAEYQARVNAIFAQGLLQGAKCSEAKKAALGEADTSTQPAVAKNDNKVANNQGTDIAITVGTEANSSAFISFTLNGTNYANKFTIAVPSCDAAN